MPEKKFENLHKYLLNYAAGSIFFACSLFAFCLLTLVFKQQISGVQFYLAAITTICFTLWSAKKLGFDKYLLSGVVVSIFIAVSILGSIFVSRQFYDLSADGQGYHGESMIQISEGWNYVYDSNKVNSYLNRTTIWTEAYPKAAWTDSVAIYKLTGNYEDGKMFAMLMILVSLAIAYVALKSLSLSNIQSLFIALLAAFNPISVVQATSYNLDGLTSSYFVILLSIFTLIITTKQKYFEFILLPLTVILLSNTKTAGLIYAIIFSAAFLAFKILYRRENLFAIGRAVVISLFLAFVVFGFNPYITNALHFGHPLHPLLGKKKFKDFDENVPANYLKRNNLDIFVSSLFFKSDAFFGGYNNPKDIAVVKIPFTYDNDELVAMRGANTKKGGFGPLFSGAIVVALAILAVSSIMIYTNSSKNKKAKVYKSSNNKNESFEVIAENISDTQVNDEGNIKASVYTDKEKIFVTLYLTVVIILSSIINNTSNNARYVPYVWLFLIIVLTFAFSLRKKLFTVLSYICGLIILTNIILVGYTNITYQYDTTQVTKTRLQEISEQTKTKPVKVNFGYMTATRLRLKDNDIKFTAIPRDEALKCNETGRYSFLPSNETNACK